MTENSKSTQTDPSSEESTMSDIEQQKETKRNLERDIATLKSEKIRLSMENANSKRELEETKAAKVTDEQENLRNGPRTSSQGAGAEGGRAVKSGDQTRDRDIQEHTEDSPHDGARLTNTPIMHLGRSLYIHFVLLLFKIAELFHLGDPNHVKKFKTWAREQFSADGSIHQILLYLYTTKVIDALDMRKLIEFFCRQDILRFDIRHIIDCFSIGDYALILLTVDVCQGASNFIYPLIIKFMCQYLHRCIPKPHTLDQVPRPLTSFICSCVQHKLTCFPMTIIIVPGKTCQGQTCQGKLGRL